MAKRCPSCGYNNFDDAAYCSGCGGSVAGTQPAPFLKPVPSVRVVTSISPGGPVMVPAPGQCFYHPSLPAVYVCNRCGRTICRDDSKGYVDLVLCPQCYQSVVPISPQPQLPAPSYTPPQSFQPQLMMSPPPMMQEPYPMFGMQPEGYWGRPRALWGFILSMIAGILVILNAAALLSNSFYNMWVGVFFWIPVLDASASHGLIFAYGAIY
ncbi:MAG: hypothetical protein ABSA92_14520 [Candidatus Bathyarchaeia archaeon]